MNKLFTDELKMRWWLGHTELDEDEFEKLDFDTDYIQALNGDLSDVSTILPNEGTEREYKYQKERLFKHIDCDNTFSDYYELLLKKRATAHINELFNHYVDDNTLVVTSAFEHFSAESAARKCKNVIKFDSEDENSNIVYHLDEVLEECKKYKSIFVYLIGTECITGRRHSNNVYEKFREELTKLNIPFVMVLDAVQEMFLFPRDYSIFDYIIGTTHSTYDKFDCGLLFINKRLVKQKDIEAFTGHKRVDILTRLNDGLDIILKRFKYIMSFNSVMEDALNKELFKEFKVIHSQPNFYSICATFPTLKDDILVKYISDKMSKWAINAHSGIAIDVSKHKKERELVIGMRAQTLMLETDETIERYNNFYNNYIDILKRLRNGKL